MSVINASSSVSTQRLTTQAYFDDILPWQREVWSQLRMRYVALPHAMLFAGMQGIGKRAFVWRFVAWGLCDNRLNSPEGACGHCQSCQWLIAGTHPDLYVIPSVSQPTLLDVETSSSKSDKKSTKGSTKNKASKENTTTIKIDDIRRLLPFINQGSQKRRFCVIDHADVMTIAAANALLKTLEEPRDGVFLLLISDTPTKLLPTIKSRVQPVAIHKIIPEQGLSYLMARLRDERDLEAVGGDERATNDDIMTQASQALRIASGAPLTALSMLKSTWYQKQTRQNWIKTWLALKCHKRSSTAASDYWQTVIPLEDFITLTEIMLTDFNRCRLQLDSLQQDLSLMQYDAINHLTDKDIASLLQVINNIRVACQQNVQPKLSYDRLMVALALFGNTE